MSAYVFTQETNNEVSMQKQDGNNFMVKNIISKFSKKEPLSQDEENFLRDMKNYSLGGLGGLTFFYLVPPVGFGVMGLFLAKVALGVAGGYGLVELSKHLSWDDFKQSIHELLGQED